MIARQTWAILVDSYRELNAKKLFWITMILSVLIVVVFAMIGVGDKGVSFLWFVVPGSEEFAQRIDAAVFYKYWMYVVGIGIWLTWVATILALVSTSTIFPDLVQSGSIDLMLSKPISRLRLFLTKYFSGLLFVALQVAVFSIGSFLVVGIRGGSWEPRLFLAVPIIVIFFSYLFSVCALLGVVTRSAIASLLLTILLWLGLFGLNATEAILLQVKVQREYSIDFNTQRVEYFEPRLERLEAKIAESEAAGTEPDKRDESRIAYGREQLDIARKEVKQSTDSLPGIDKWADRITMARAVLPKTNETIELLNRYLMDFDEISAFFPPDQRSAFTKEDAEKTGAEAPAADPDRIKTEPERLNEIYAGRSLWWVIGTSLGFEAVIVALAALMFWRRDF